MLVAFSAYVGVGVGCIVLGCEAEVVGVGVERTHDVAAFVDGVDARAADCVEVLFLSHGGG